MSSAWDIGAQAISSPNPMVGLLKGIFGQRAAKAKAKYEKAQIMHGVHDAERGQQEFEQNAPIQEQGMQQSLASRGVGTSSIAEQDTKNLLATQARQRAAHAENVNVAHMGLSAYNKQRKYARRMGPLAFWEAASNAVAGAVGSMTGMPGLSGMGKGGGGAPTPTSAWDSGIVQAGGP